MTKHSTDGSTDTQSAAQTSKRPSNRYAEFLRNSSLGIWCSSFEKPISITLPLEKQIAAIYKYGFISEANDRMATMRGLSSSRQLEGARIKDLWPLRVQGNREYAANFITSGYRLRDVETHETDAGGNERYFLNSLIGIEENGKLLGAWGTQLDITRLHEATNALKESEARLKLALDASGAGMWEWNIPDHVLNFSEQLTSILGNPKKISSSPEGYFEYIYPEDIPRLRRVVKAAIKDRKSFEIEHRIVWPDGSLHWLLCRGQTLYDGNEKPIRVLGTCMNIDERKSAELLRLETDKLDDERRRLVELNIAKDEFIALASHQLRTPATSVKQYLGILLEGVLGDLQLTDDQMKVLNTAYESNERQITIINDLLLVATIDAGKMKLHTRPVDLGKLVRDIMRDSRKEHGDRKYDLKIKAVDEPIVILCDRERIRMALENVISNAFKYSPENELVTVEVARTQTDVVIRVTDHGVGIDKLDLPRLFQKFSRISNPLSISSGGTGLGVYWTEKIITLHNGTIKVSSQPGIKTTFVIRLPL